jgi:hypothetical protein
MDDEKTGDRRSICSMAMRPPEGRGEMISGSSTKGAAASRSKIGGGGERVGMKWETTPRFLSARMPRARPCSTFPKNMNLEAIEKTMWNIVNWRVES